MPQTISTRKPTAACEVPQDSGMVFSTPEKRTPSGRGVARSGSPLTPEKDTSKTAGVVDSGIKVAVRIRPAKDGEVTARRPPVVIDKEHKTVSVTQEDVHDNPKVTTHVFDEVYDDQCKQSDLYEEFGIPLLDKVFNWYNGTLFAYGQTGSGKTHSMLGPTGAEGTEEVGMIPRMVKEVYKRIMLGNELRKKAEKEGEVSTRLILKVTYLEIYQERLVDLLIRKHRNPWDGAPKLKIRYHPDTGVYVEGATEPTVATYDDLRQLMSEGDTRRQVAAHELNERSSRSHAVFTLKLFEVYDAGDQGQVPRKWSRLNMCDLAGSERQKQTHAAGVRLVESSNINKGLLTLQRVIAALAKENKANEVNVVPFRESKLTQLLEESLGGTALCAMIACASPAEHSTAQTALTLRYAASAKRIRKIVVQNKEITETAKLQGEVDRLMAQLAQAQEADKKDAAKQYEEKIARLEQVLAAEAHSKAEWQAAIAEERRRAMLNATVPGRVALYLQDIGSPAADIILQLERRITAAEAEYYQVMQLIESLEGAVQAELDGMAKVLPEVEDNALERLVVQLRTVQGETRKVKKLRDGILALYKELEAAAAAEASRLVFDFPELTKDGGSSEAGAASGDQVTGDEAFLQVATKGAGGGAPAGTIRRSSLALQGVRELERYVSEGMAGILKYAWGSADGQSQRPRGFQVDVLMAVVLAVEEHHHVAEKTDAKLKTQQAVQAGTLMGGTLRLNVIDYAVDTLDAALENFRHRKAAALEDFMQEYQELQERSIRLAQLLELKEAEATELMEQRDELLQEADEANAMVERLQAAQNLEAVKSKKAAAGLKQKNKALRDEAAQLQAELRAVTMEMTRMKNELEAGAVRQSEADHRAGELTAEVSRYRDEAARLQAEVQRHEETAATALMRRDATQSDLSALQKQFSELQLATAVEGKSAEHVVKSLKDANKERQDLRDRQVEMQTELDGMRASKLEQQERLVELQTTKLALADAEARVKIATAEAEHARQVLELGAKDQELLEIVKKLLSDQQELRKSLSAEEVDSLKEQKRLLQAEVDLRAEASARAAAEAETEAQKKAELQEELAEMKAQLEELKKKSKLCVVM